MKCWHCNTELIWGGDHDIEEDDEYCMETNLSCPQCNSFVMVYLPKNFMDFKRIYRMWDHYCPIEETEMAVGKDEECNWCGAIEEDEKNDNSNS